MPTETDLKSFIHFLSDEKPLDFQTSVSDELNLRIASALERRREEMAHGLLNPSEVEDHAEINSDTNSDPEHIEVTSDGQDA